MDEVCIEKLDNMGRGICYTNNKITFVENALPTEIVKIEITYENKKYREAIVKEYIKKSKLRRGEECPYFKECGGCKLLNVSYEETINFKKEKLQSIFKKYVKYNNNIDVISMDKNYGYRNKITLKVANGKYGYYESKTHNLVEIKNCLMAEEAIQQFFKDIKLLGIKNGEVILRTNYNNELLIVIKSIEKVNIKLEELKRKHKIAGIVINNKIYDGDNVFVEIINNNIFQVSYDSFFQVNREGCRKLFELVDNEVEKNDIILDLYCGVGTLGINSHRKIKKIYGIEIVKNAILNAIKNAKMNKVENAFYMLGDVGKCLDQVKDEIKTVIVDPPRTGLDKQTKEILIKRKIKKIIYVSCDPMTLVRDINDLNTYRIEKVVGLDMFPYSYHVECVCILSLR